MKATAKLDRDAVLHSKENTVNLMVSISAPDESTEKKRNPLSICAVIDRSGSMGGQKIEHVKRSMYKLIDHLTEEDSLAIVFFDDRVGHVDFKSMSSAAKELMKKEIASIDARGSTDIGAAMSQAIKMFKSHEGPANCMERIMLLTDGQANQGATHYEQFLPILRTRRENIGVSCFGYGDSFNEELLKELSKEGKGSNYFIESPDSVAKVFAVELGGLLTCYAQAISIDINPHKGNKVVNVLNDFDVDTVQDQDGELITKVTIDDLFCGETRNVVIRLVCEKRSQALPRETTLADIKISYKTLSDAKEQSEDIKAKIRFVKDSDDITQDPDKDVAEQVTLLEAANIQVEAKKLADSGNWMGARSLYDASINSLRSIGTSRTTSYADKMDDIRVGYTDQYVAGNFTAKSASAMSTSLLRSRAAYSSGNASDMSAGSLNVMTQSLVADFTGNQSIKTVTTPDASDNNASNNPSGYKKVRKTT